jgi:alpha-D-xyloside xylohydrolase
MLGPAFLVCPVYRPSWFGPGSTPIEHGPGGRPVYLPAGGDWFDFWTDRCLSGGQVVEVEAALEQIPVFVRAGSIVPMGPVRQHTGEAPDALLEVHVYPGRDASFTLYDDEGDGYGYELGAFATVEIGWNDAARRLTIGDRAGIYPGMPEERTIAVTLHPAARPASAGAGSAEGLGAHLLCYAGRAVEVQL